MASGWFPTADVMLKEVVPLGAVCSSALAMATAMAQPMMIVACTEAVLVI